MAAPHDKEKDAGGLSTATTDDHAERVRRAVEAADGNILRLALYQITNDERLARMRVEQVSSRGGAFLKTVLTEDDDKQVRAIARELLEKGLPGKISPPDANETRRLIELFEGGPVDEEVCMLGADELALDDYPRDATWNKKPSRERLAAYEVLVVGAGLAGLLAGIHLRRLGLPFSIVDRQADVGGVWETNRYPEARVDITSFLYQYKFEKNYPWSEYYASREDNQNYLRHLARKHGVLEAISFRTEVLSATWDDAEAMWSVRLRGPDGVEYTRKARIILSASGQFTTPRDPVIKGLDSFEGEKFHTTRWNHDYDLSGKKVAIIGNGSTGTQLLRDVAARARHVTLYQRTPQWIGGVENYRNAISPETRWLIDNVPGYWNWLGYSAYSESLPFQYYQYRDEDWIARGGRVSEKSEKMREMLVGYIRAQVNGDEKLVEKLTPQYAPFARRMVVDNGFYQSLTRPNVELVTDGIERINARSIMSSTGEARETDLIVLAVGFEVARYFWPIKYTGRDGMTLEKLWRKDGPRALLGVALPGFPNFFCFYGPNSQGRFLGLTTWAETWWRYMAQVIVALVERGARSVECTWEAFETYNRAIDEEMTKLIWETEGAGGYHTRDYGRSVIHAPWTIQKYNALLRHADLNDFKFET